MDKKYVDKCTVFSTVVGSQAYGTNTPESDIDIRGVAVLDDLSYYYGFLKNFEQFEDSVDDTVIYDVRKAFRLISNCNPNMLDLLFVEERFHKKLSRVFAPVLENRDMFLSKKARYSYTGYAFAQLKRIRTARSWLLNPPEKKPERSDFGLPVEKLITPDDMGAFRWVMIHLLKDSIDYTNLSDELKKELSDANWIGLAQSKGVPEQAFEQVQKITGASDAWMDIMKREQAYINSKRHYGSYTQWKNSRNPKRAELEAKFGYDTKHASHLVRLLRMGQEIISTGKVLVFRPDHEELKDIRNHGIWSYEELVEYADSMEESIIELTKTSKLPKEPNRVFLDKLCQTVIQECLSTGYA